MKNTILYVLSAILLVSGTALADTKVKIKQTMSGQTMENTTYIKGKRQRTEMMGGAMISLTQCDLGRDLQMNPGTKTYTVTYYDDGTTKPGMAASGQAGAVTKGGTMTVTTTIKDTGERKQMFGFTARHIIQTIETESTPDACVPSKTKMEMDMWVIDAEFGIACTQTRQYNGQNGGKSAGCQDKIVQKTLGTGKSGYPLWQKMTSFDASGKVSFSMTQEVVELSKATLDQALFEAPADYREVKSTSEMYASSGTSGLSYNGPSNSSSSSSSGMSSNIRNAADLRNDAPTIGAKKEGTIRIGLAGVKTGAVGEGITAADLSAAIQNSLSSYLKGTKVEIVPLEAKLASAQADEAKQKECDYILTATASHKKGGGGGFGGFGKMLGSVVSQTGIGHTGSTVGNIAGQMATTAIVSATSLSGNVKSKDELTLDLAIVSIANNSSVLAKQFKAKAKSNGDDIISTVVEQAAQAIIDTVGK